MRVQEKLKQELLKLFDTEQYFLQETSLEQRAKDPTKLGLEGPVPHFGKNVIHLLQARAGNYDLSLSTDVEYELFYVDRPRMTALVIYVSAEGDFERIGKRGRNKGVVSKWKHTYNQAFICKGTSFDFDNIVEDITSKVNSVLIRSRLTPDMVENLMYTELLNPRYLTSMN